jgi:hypothetical protein
MKLPEYVLIEHPTELKDATLILQTVPPFIIGQVWRFQDGEDIESKGLLDKALSQVPGYRIVVAYKGALVASMSGTVEEPHVSYKPEVVGIMRGMAEFYNRVRIVPNATRFKRYRIDQALDGDLGGGDGR